MITSLWSPSRVLNADNFQPGPVSGTLTVHTPRSADSVNPDQLLPLFPSPPLILTGNFSLEDFKEMRIARTN